METALAEMEEVRGETKSKSERIVLLEGKLARCVAPTQRSIFIPGHLRSFADALKLHGGGDEELILGLSMWSGWKRRNEQLLCVSKMPWFVSRSPQWKQRAREDSR